MDTCGWCGDRGCTDGHTRCKAWTKQGMCIHNPVFMAHTCRESCGLCGFLSSDDNEEQIEGSSSYSDISKENFKCGTGKPKDQRFDKDKSVVDAPKKTVEFFSSSDDDICGATLITDKWCLGAAHCFDDFESSGRRRIQTLKIRTERETEIIDVKRVFRHPGYKY